jgi:CRP/FNR family transcriptional regulator, cyclic AMP receptor protein
MPEPDTLFDGSQVWNSGWLGGTPAEFRNAVLARSDRIILKAGQAVYHFGDDVGGIVGVAEGFLQIHGPSPADDPTLFFIAGPGFWTGEFATATGQPRIVALQAHTDLVLLRLPRAEFLRIAATDPRAWHLLAVLSTRNTALALDLIAMLRRTRPEERLLYLVHLLGREVPGHSRVIPVTQADLGVIARMSRSAVNAALGALERQGLIRVGYKGVELIDPARIASIVTQG